MQKFAFSLQRILGFKQTMYEKERNVLAQLRMQRATLEKRREDTQAQMLRVDAEFRKKAAEQGVRIQEVTRVSFHRESSDKLIKVLSVQIKQMDDAIEKQLKIVMELNKEVKSLEKLRESQWDEWQADFAREERERILELVSGRFVERQAAEQGAGVAN